MTTATRAVLVLTGRCGRGTVRVVEEAEQPLFSARFSIALLAVFLLPLVIRLLTTLEPFPAIILPGNSARITV